MQNETLQVNFQPEMGRLLAFAGRVAVAIRLYSTYSHENKYNYGQEICDVDVMWLSDCIHHFEWLGDVIVKNDPTLIRSCCISLIGIYSGYQKDHRANQDNPRRASAPAFARNCAHFSLSDAIAIFTDIKNKLDHAHIEPC